MIVKIEEKLTSNTGIIFLYSFLILLVIMGLGFVMNFEFPNYFGFGIWAACFYLIFLASKNNLYLPFFKTFKKYFLSLFYNNISDDYNFCS